MKIASNTRIMTLLKKYPFLEDFLISKYPELKILKNKVLRKTIGKTATLSKVSGIIDVNMNSLMRTIVSKIEDETGGKLDISETGGDDRNENILKLKKIIKEMHETGNKEKAKKDFKKLLTTVDPDQIVEMEQLLIQEGTDVLEIQKLCDAHLEIMYDGLSKDALKDIPAGHPIDVYMNENKQILKKANKLNNEIRKISDSSKQVKWLNLTTLIKEFRAIDLHYTRKENQLFPYLEKKGITGPSQVMWAIHDEIREDIKNLLRYSESHNVDKLKRVSSGAIRKIIEMVRKEELILFPMALESLTDEEWYEVKKGENEIGFSFLKDIPEWKPEKPANDSQKEGSATEEIKLTTGSLNREEIERILLTVPVDMSYVDENDEVKFYTGGEHRIFPRSPGVIGRNVENCHPPASVDKVRQILDAFKNEEKDVAEFWIEIKGKFVHIRYFAVRDASGKYMGTLEFMQDVTGIRNLEGERRLLDWS